MASAAPIETAQALCLRVLESGDLASKLLRPRGPDGKLLPLPAELDAEMAEAARRFESPAREPKLRLHPGSEPLPPLGTVMDPARPEARALCLERFAHHELQAIELMAWAVLALAGPDGLPLGLRKALLLTLEEEQEHLRLYLGRLAAYGGQLGDAPLSDYLWQHRAGIAAATDPRLAFLSAVGLTFEQANLDFTLLFRDAFRAAGDEDSARVLQRVHDDEIRHVRIAAHWLRRLKPAGVSDVAAYVAAVPFPLSAARAKGRRFDLPARRRAGLSDAMIAHVRAAQPYPRTPVARERAQAQATPGPDEARPRWLLPNLGAEENRPVPAGARGFLRGLLGAWATLFDARVLAPLLLPPGEPAAQAGWRAALSAERAGPAFHFLADDAAGQSGQLVAWLPTAAAADEAAKHRLALSGPSPEVVARVHDKAFAHRAAVERGLVPEELRPLLSVFEPDELRRADFCRQVTERLATVAAPLGALSGGRFTLKPRHGTSGRGRVMGIFADGWATLLPDSPSAWTTAAAALAARGGCLLEPWLPRTRDLSVQLYVPPPEAGRPVEILGTTRQLLTPSGQILGNRGVIGAGGDALRAEAAADADALVQAATELGAAAAAAGFFGVAGLDAFAYRGASGAERLRPVVELNARFTTGTVALGLVRLAQRVGLTAGLHAWALVLKAPQAQALEAALRAAGPGAARVVAPAGTGGHGPLLILARDEAVLDGLLPAGVA